MNIDVKLLDQEIQRKKKYVFELEHIPPPTGKTRKGLKINKRTKKL